MSMKSFSPNYTKNKTRTSNKKSNQQLKQSHKDLNKSANNIGSKKNARQNIIGSQDQGNLIKKLGAHRQKLSRRLHHHTFMYSMEKINKCGKHDCYFSVYSTVSRQLLCAECLTSSTRHARPKETHLKQFFSQFKLAKQHQSPKKEVKTQKQRKSNKCLVPLEKAKADLQTDIRLMKFQIQGEHKILREIQDILYSGFEQEQLEFQKNLKIMDEKHDYAIHQLIQSKKNVRELLVDEFSSEWKKHQLVIKQLGLLRKLIQDYWTQCYKNGAQTLPHSLHVNQAYLASHQLNWVSKSGFPSENDAIKQIVYKHAIGRQLIQNIKFSKSPFNWDKQQHKNKIKQISTYFVNKIEQVIKDIQILADASILTI